MRRGRGACGSSHGPLGWSYPPLGLTLARGAARALGRAGTRVGLAVSPVVPGTSLGVGQDLVGFGDLPEPSGGVWVPGLGIGVSLAGEAPVGVSDLLLSGLRHQP